jgi:DNA repair exonuclease SbcCD ATPase subunit
LAAPFFRWRNHAWKARVRGALTEALVDVTRQEEASWNLNKQLKEALEDAANYRIDAEVAKCEAFGAAQTIQDLVNTQTQLTDRLEEYAAQLRDGNAARHTAESQLQGMRSRATKVQEAQGTRVHELQAELREAREHREELLSAISYRDNQVCG